MGIGAHRVAWAACVVVAGVCAWPTTWTVWLAALGLAVCGLVAARRWPPWSAAVAAMALSPLLLAAVDGPWFICALGAVALASAWAGPTPRPIPALVLAMGAFQCARLTLLADVPPGGRTVAVDLLLCAGLVAGAARSSPGDRQGSGAIAVIAAVGLCVTAGVGAARIDADADGELLARLGWADVRAAELAAHPAVGLRALRVAPDAQRLPRLLLPRVGMTALLEAGWRPSSPLPPTALIEGARWLESRGRGGEAVRLLWSDRRHPMIGWQLELFRRLGVAQSPEHFNTAPPADVPVLDSSIDVDWGFYTAGSQVIDVHAQDARTGLILTTIGEAHRGPPVLHLDVDGGPAQSLIIPEGRADLPVPLVLTPGPHRVRIAYRDDVSDSTGDRNARVLRISPAR